MLGTEARNIDAVFVAGQPRKWDGQLLGLDLDRLRAEVRESRDAILEREARHEGAAV